MSFDEVMNLVGRDIDGNKVLNKGIECDNGDSKIDKMTWQDNVEKGSDKFVVKNNSDLTVGKKEGKIEHNKGNKVTDQVIGHNDRLKVVDIMTVKSTSDMNDAEKILVEGMEHNNGNKVLTKINDNDSDTLKNGGSNTSVIDDGKVNALDDTLPFSACCNIFKSYN